MNNIGSFNPRTFSKWAGSDFALWRTLIGKYVTHIDMGVGKVLNIEKDLDDPHKYFIIFVEFAVGIRNFGSGYFSRLFSKIEGRFEEDIEKALASYRFSEADDLFKHNQDKIDKYFYYNLKRRYKTLENIEALLSSNDYDIAVQRYQDYNGRVLSENLGEKYRIEPECFQGLEAKYYTLRSEVISHIEESLKGYHFNKAEKIYTKNKSIVSINLYQQLVDKYSCLKNIELLIQQDQLSEAERKYLEYNSECGKKGADTHVITNILFQSLVQRRRYSLAILNIKTHMEQREFDEAERVYLDYNNTLEGNDTLKKYLITSNSYKEQQKKYIRLHLISDLSRKMSNKNFLDAEQQYLNNKNLISVNEYYNLKSKFIRESFLSIEPDLNEEQANAITKFNKYVLVQARAGSGKTTTIACKAINLLLHEKVGVEQVLLLAFNRKARDEMNIRLRDKYGVTPSPLTLTFHGLAYNIVRPHQNILYDEEGGLSKKHLSQFIQQIIRQTWDDEFKSELYKYFRNEADELESQDIGLSGQDYYTFRRNITYTTLNGEQVKSKGEKFIADFLFEHGISYTYEKTLFWGNERYQPDFYLNVSRSCKIILEHWGINENDSLKQVPVYWTNTWQDYYNSMQAKRLYCQREGYILLETSVNDLRLGREKFESILMEKLAQIGIECVRLPEGELIRRLVEPQITKITAMFTQFIQRAKKKKMSPNKIDEIISEGTHTPDIRTQSFLRLANTVYLTYEKKLKETYQIDFDDLIKMATEKIISAGKECTLTVNKRQYPLINIRYLLIDEYQDFSLLFYDMVQAIISVSPDIRLFCVGDDWQAINSFAGSDLRYYEKFNSLFPDSVISPLQINYRNGEHILNYGNALMSNKGLLSICCLNNKGKGHIVVEDISSLWIEVRQGTQYATNRENDEKFLFRNKNGHIFDDNYIKARYLKKCYQICEEHIDKSVVILCRTNMICGVDLSFFEKKLREALTNCTVFKGSMPHVRTVHDFKGMEADVIIVLRTCVGMFPLIHSECGLYEIFGQSKKDLLDDERRLFYVALTRARKSLYLLTELGQESQYLAELSLKAINNKCNS